MPPFSYPLIFNDFADIDGCLGILSEVPLLLEKEALSALPTQFWTKRHTISNEPRMLNILIIELWMWCDFALLPGWVVYWMVRPLGVVCLKQWMEIGWSTMKSLLITSHSLGQSRAILCRRNSTTWDHSSSAQGSSYILFDHCILWRIRNICSSTTAVLTWLFRSVQVLFKKLN